MLFRSVWWSRRATPKDFVRVFDSCQRDGQETIDGALCDSYRLTVAAAVLTISVPDDGIPRRWVIDGPAFLPDSFENQLGIKLRRTEDWSVRRISQTPDAESFSYNLALEPGYREWRDYLIEDPDSSRRLVGGPMPEWSAPSLSETPAVSSFNARAADGPFLIAFVASWSVGSRDALPFFAALDRKSVV